MIGMDAWNVVATASRQFVILLFMIPPIVAGKRYLPATIWSLLTKDNEENK
jgi:hypothetical protein